MFARRQKPRLGDQTDSCAVRCEVRTGGKPARSDLWLLDREKPRLVTKCNTWRRGTCARKMTLAGGWINTLLPYPARCGYNNPVRVDVSLQSDRAAPECSHVMRGKPRPPRKIVGHDKSAGCASRAASGSFLASGSTNIHAGTGLPFSRLIASARVNCSPVGNVLASGVVGADIEIGEHIVRGVALAQRFGRERVLVQVQAIRAGREAE